MSTPRCGAVTATGAPCRRFAKHGGPCAWHDPARKPEGRAWPKSRLWHLTTLLEDGLDDDQIARKLGTTREAVKLARKRHGIAARGRVVLTGRAVARKLGIPCEKTIARWVTKGYLRGRRAWRQGPHRVLTVREADLFAFLEDPRHWQRWDPERITDPVLREWAQELRRGVRFLTLSEVADRYFVQPATVHSWIEKGYLPAVRNGNHLVRESDLASFTLPRIGGHHKAAA